MNVSVPVVCRLLAPSVTVPPVTKLRFLSWLSAPVVAMVMPPVFWLEPMVSVPGVAMRSSSASLSAKLPDAATPIVAIVVEGSSVTLPALVMVSPIVTSDAVICTLAADTVAPAFCT